MFDWEYWLNDYPAHAIAYTRNNVADSYPRPLTPLSQDLVLTFEEAAVREQYCSILRILSPQDGPDPYLQAFYGFVCVNADQLAGLGERTPGSSRQAIYQQFLGLEADPAYRPPRVSPGTRLVQVRSGAAVAPRLFSLGRDIKARIERHATLIQGARPGGELAALSDAEVAAWWRRLDGFQVEAFVCMLAGPLVAGILFDTTRKVLGAWAGDTTGDLTNRLFVALGGHESAEAARAVRMLADLVSREEMGDALDQADPETTLREASPACAGALDDFLRRFGHRGPAELELANPTYRADPVLVLNLVRVELGRPRRSEEGAAVRNDAEAELRRRLNPVQRGVAFPLLRRARSFLAVRENGKRPVTMLFDELRRLVSVAAPRLAERGVLPAPELFCYLRHAEVGPVLAGEGGPGGDELLRRRAEHQRCLTLELPELLEAGPIGLRPLDAAAIAARGLLPPPKSDAAMRLRGVGASPGAFRGLARVLSDPWMPFDAGDVLFARTVDPGWAPILACAGAVVLDLGGTLSHGAVVARELGIPCVVNVKLGTVSGVDGSIVTVDGSTGEVVWGGETG